MEYRTLTRDDITPALFATFDRRQEVTRCWRKVDGQWCIADIAFIDEWDAADYDELVRCLCRTVDTGGVVYGAFAGGQLKGFCSVEPQPFGSQKQYLDLSSLHVSADLRRQGAGRELFSRAAAWAREHGAHKLYISAHSAVETQAFYRALGCVEAAEYNAAHVEKEPCDCQMEYAL